MPVASAMSESCASVWPHVSEGSVAQEPLPGRGHGQPGAGRSWNTVTPPNGVIRKSSNGTKEMEPPDRPDVTIGQPRKAQEKWGQALRRRPLVPTPSPGKANVFLPLSWVVVSCAQQRGQRAQAGGPTCPHQQGGQDAETPHTMGTASISFSLSPTSLVFHVVLTGPREPGAQRRFMTPRRG